MLVSCVIHLRHASAQKEPRYHLLLPMNSLLLLVIGEEEGRAVDDPLPPCTHTHTYTHVEQLHYVPALCVMNRFWQPTKKKERKI